MLVSIENQMCIAGKGRFGTFLADISGFYCEFHYKCYNKHIVYLHDPAAMLAVLRKELFQWEQGPALVSCEGPMRGKTLVDCALLHAELSLQNDFTTRCYCTHSCMHTQNHVRLSSWLVLFIFHNCLRKPVLCLILIARTAICS